MRRLAVILLCVMASASMGQTTHYVLNRVDHPRGRDVAMPVDQMPYLVFAQMMNAPDGTNFADCSLQHNDCGATGTAACLPSWVNGFGTYFDGTNDFVTTPDNASLNVTTSLTMMVWIRPAKTGVFAYFLGKWYNDPAANDRSYAMFQGNGNPPTLTFYISEDGGTGDRMSWQTPTVTMNQWVHFAATWNAAQPTNMYLYTNAVLCGSVAAAGNISTLHDSDIGISLGRSGWDDSAYYGGYIRAAMVFNTQLSAAQIAAWYRAGR